MNPHDLVAKSHGLANRPDQPYSAAFRTRRFLFNGVEGVRTPDLDTASVALSLLSYHPVRSTQFSGQEENRTPRTDLARISRPLGTCLPGGEAKDGIEPSSPHYQCGALPLSYTAVWDMGVEPNVSSL